MSSGVCSRTIALRRPLAGRRGAAIGDSDMSPLLRSAEVTSRFGLVERDVPARIDRVAAEVGDVAAELSGSPANLAVRLTSASKRPEATASPSASVLTEMPTASPE